MNIGSTQPIPTIPLPMSPVLAVKKHGVHWLQIILTQISLPYDNIPTSLWIENYPIRPEITNFCINSYSSMLKTYGICEDICVLQGRTDDYSSWSFRQCWIQCHCQEFSVKINVYHQSEENTSPNVVTAVILSFSLYRFILPYFCMVFRYVYVCDDCISIIVLFDFIFVKRPRMLPVQFVTQIKTCKPLPKPTLCCDSNSFMAQRANC